MNASKQPGSSGETAVSSPPVAVQQTTVIQVGSQKSVVGAVLLAFFFGPLGMLYATVPGALVMFVVNIIVIIPTLGLGLIVTLPIGCIWAGIAASNHNSRLGTMSTQAVASGAPPTAAAVAQSPRTPAGWHPDPDGSSRLRYWDGERWTEHFADQPQAASERSTAQLGSGSGSTTEPVAEVVDTAAPVNEVASDEAPTVATEAEAKDVFCESCGQQINAGDRFCAACGGSQAPID